MIINILRHCRAAVQLETGGRQTDALSGRSGLCGQRHGADQRRVHALRIPRLFDILHGTCGGWAVINKLNLILNLKSTLW